MHFFSPFLAEKQYHTLARRLTLPSSKTLIYGAPKSGKTSLALDFATNSNISSKKIIYLNLNDLRISHDEAKSELLKLYLEKKIELLIIDHFKPSFLLPHLENIVLLSDEKQEMPKFQSMHCPNLTFIEYLSFCSKNISADSLLKNFIKDGNLPSMPFLSEHQKIQTKQEILKLALGEDLSLLSWLLPFQSQKITTFQFFTMLKKHIKISKDKIYLFFDKLEKIGIMICIPHIQPSRPKKLYFCDFSLPKALTLHHTILPILENMFVLELLALSQEVYYDDFGCFVVPYMGRFLFMPFAEREVIEKKLSKFPKEDLTIVTLNFSHTEYALETHWKAMTFIEFALGGIE